MRTLFLSSSSSSWPHPLDTATPSSLLPRRSLSRELLFHFLPPAHSILSICPYDAYSTDLPSSIAAVPPVGNRSQAAGTAASCRRRLADRRPAAGITTKTWGICRGRAEHIYSPQRAPPYRSVAVLAELYIKNNCSVGTTCTQLNRSRLSLAAKISIMTNVWTTAVKQGTILFHA